MTDAMFLSIQKKVCKYVDTISHEEFILLVDKFVFYGERESEIIIKVLNDFLNHFQISDIYERHMNDRKKNPYFLSCSGSDLNMLEYIGRALLVKSYNLFRHDTVRNITSSDKK